MREYLIFVANVYGMCYTKCVLNIRSIAVIAPDFVRGAQILYVKLILTRRVELTLINTLKI